MGAIEKPASPPPEMEKHRMTPLTWSRKKDADGKAIHEAACEVTGLRYVVRMFDGMATAHVSQGEVCEYVTSSTEEADAHAICNGIDPRRLRTVKRVKAHCEVHRNNAYNNREAA